MSPQSRFDVPVEGSDLARAASALHAADIPTLTGGAVAPAGEGASARRRFLRSPAFAILLVVVLAFLVQRIAGPGDDAREPSYDQFLTQVERAPETIERVTLDPDATEIEVAERDGGEYTTGYPPSSEDSLVAELRRQGIETQVEDSEGSSLLSWITYLLPFMLFFGFWLFLSRRMERRGAGSASWEPDRLTAVVVADSSAQAEQLVRAGLPPDGGYSVGPAKARG